MTKLIFIRHAPTVPDKNQHSTQWQLSDESQALCKQLAKQIESHNLVKIYTSTEMKARLTGQFVAKSSGNIPVQVSDNLQETERQSKAFYDSQAEFRKAVEMAMQSPDDLLFGDETFTDARNRFARQMEQLARQHERETIAIVSHGRVLAMYLAGIMKQSPVVIWQKLKMPAYAILSWEHQSITDIQYKIEAV